MSHPQFWLWLCFLKGQEKVMVSLCQVHHGSSIRVTEKSRSFSVVTSNNKYFNHTLNLLSILWKSVPSAWSSGSNQYACQSHDVKFQFPPSSHQLPDVNQELPSLRTMATHKHTHIQVHKHLSKHTEHISHGENKAADLSCNNHLPSSSFWISDAFQQEIPAVSFS